METIVKRGRPRKIDGRENNNRLDEVYLFVVEYAKDHHNRTPTLREIGAALGISSTSLVKYYIDKLVKQKRIGHEDGVSRGIWIV